MEVDFENGKINVRDDLVYEFKELVTRKEMKAIKQLRDKHAKLEEEGIENLSVDEVEKIEEEWFNNVDIVGLTAGASVPDELLDPIINSLMAKGIEKIDTITVAQETVEFKPPNDLPIPRRTLTQ